MKKQLLGLILLTAFLASLMVASAAISFTDSITSLTITQSDTSKSFTVATGNDLANFTYTTNSNLIITTTTLNNVTNVTFTVSPAISIPLGSNDYTFSINATNVTNSTDSKSKTMTITLTNNTNKLCAANYGNLDISDIEFDVLSGFGDEDDLFFYPLDEVEVSFNIENTGEDIEDIEITACLFDESAEKCVLDEDDMEISKDSFDLDEDDEDITLTFEVDPDKLEAGNTNYILYLGAKGDLADNESSVCTSGSEDGIDIITNDDFAVINNIVYTENVNCGEMLEISADIFNVGDNDFDEDEIYFEIYSKELGIDKEISFNNGIDSMSEELASFSTQIPANVSAKSYNIRLSVLDEDHDVMENKKDDASQETISVTVGKCVDTTVPSVSITAELSSDTPKAVIGEKFVVDSIIKNIGSTSATYTLSVSGNEAWSESSIEPSTFTLASGESKEVSITFDVNSDAKAGDKDFTIKVSSGAKAFEQKVEITLEEGITSSKIIQHIKENSFIYTIVLINLILLIAIIIVIVKMIGRKSDD
jgi:hypothetical protein